VQANNKDLYKLFGLSREASQEDIQQAYRESALKYHPDANPQDPQAEEHFKEIQQAYEVLSNPQRRQEYDKRFRTSSRSKTSRPPVGTSGRTEEDTIHTSSEQVRGNRGPLFSLGYLLGIMLIALVIALLIARVLGLN
jgi:DnaJ-class molecular chaperone